MSEIRIDSDAMTVAVSKAVLDSLESGQREQLIEAALKHLLTPGRNTYGRTKSPLEAAFDSAIEIAAHKHVKEILAEPGVAEQIRALVMAKVTAALAGEYQVTEAIGNAVGTAIASALRGDLR